MSLGESGPGGLLVIVCGPSFVVGTDHLNGHIYTPNGQVLTSAIPILYLQRYVSLRMAALQGCVRRRQRLGHEPSRWFAHRAGSPGQLSGRAHPAAGTEQLSGEDSPAGHTHLCRTGHNPKKAPMKRSAARTTGMLAVSILIAVFAVAPVAFAADKVWVCKVVGGSGNRHLQTGEANPISVALGSEAFDIIFRDNQASLVLQPGDYSGAEPTFGDCDAK